MAVLALLAPGALLTKRAPSATLVAVVVLGILPSAAIPVTSKRFRTVHPPHSSTTGNVPAYPPV